VHPRAHDPEGSRRCTLVSFRMPAGVDFTNLVPIKVVTKDGAERFENASATARA